jgi:hypothetical protein
VRWYETYVLNGHMRDSKPISNTEVAICIVECLLVGSDQGFWDVVEHKDGYIRLVWVDTTLIDPKTHATWEFRRE